MVFGHSESLRPGRILIRDSLRRLLQSSNGDGSSLKPLWTGSTARRLQNEIRLSSLESLLVELVHACPVNCKHKFWPFVMPPVWPLSPSSATAAIGARRATGTGLPSVGSQRDRLRPGAGPANRGPAGLTHAPARGRIIHEIRQQAVAQLFPEKRGTTLPSARGSVSLSANRIGICMAPT